MVTAPAHSNTSISDAIMLTSARIAGLKDYFKNNVALPNNNYKSVSNGKVVQNSVEDLIETQDTKESGKF
jgi:hypothetical protein